MDSSQHFNETQLRNAVLFAYREWQEACRAQCIHASELLLKTKKRGFETVSIELMIDQHIVDAIKAKFDNASLELDVYENKRPKKCQTIDQNDKN